MSRSLNEIFDVPESPSPRIAELIARRNAREAAMTPEQKAQREKQRMEADARQRLRQQEEREGKAKYLRSKSGMPSRFYAASLESIDDPTPERRNAAARLGALQMLPAIIGLIGARGAGKTYLACATMNAFFLEGRTAKYTRAMDLFLRLRATYHNKQGASEWDIIEEHTAAELLVIDEAHVRGGSTWEDNVLIELVDRRYADACKSTVILANQTPAEFIAALGPSIASRIQEGGGIIATDGWSNQRSKARGPTGKFTGPAQCTEPVSAHYPAELFRRVTNHFRNRSGSVPADAEATL